MVGVTEKRAFPQKSCGTSHRIRRRRWETGRMDGSPLIDLLHDHVEAGRLPGAVVGVADSAGIRELVALGGDADGAFGTGDRFALYSISKAMTALAVLRAVERGQVSLLDELGPALGEPVHRDVTLAHLLSHRSGILEEHEDWYRDGVERLRRGETLVPPGTTVQYSTLAFAGAAAILEHATGRSLEEHLAELGADAPSFDASGSRAVIGGDAVGVDHERMTAFRHAGAGLFGTAESLLGLASGLLRSARDGDATLLHPTTLAAARRPSGTGLPILSSEPERGQRWGLGFALLDEVRGLLDQDGFGHAGWSGTQWWIHPSRDRAWVLLTNVVEAEQFGVDWIRVRNAAAASI
jgi:CubicO group peptidase (beta-lactamase class C family)